MKRVEISSSHKENNNNNFWQSEFWKSFRHLLDKAFAHNFVAKPSSVVVLKVFNLTRKKLQWKVAGSAEYLWQQYEYHLLYA